MTRYLLAYAAMAVLGSAPASAATLTVDAVGVVSAITSFGTYSPIFADPISVGQSVNVHFDVDTFKGRIGPNFAGGCVGGPLGGPVVGVFVVGDQSISFECGNISRGTPYFADYPQSSGLNISTVLDLNPLERIQGGLNVVDLFSEYLSGSYIASPFSVVAGDNLLLLGGLGRTTAFSTGGFAGGYFVDFSFTSVTLTVIEDVPEPATWIMMIGGFGMIGASSRARRAAARPAQFDVG